MKPILAIMTMLFTGCQPVVTGTVKEILNSNHIVLDDGRNIRLVGIERCSDKISEGQDALTRAEFCEVKAILVLSKLVETGPVTITISKSDSQAGIVMTSDGKCVQEELLLKGLTKVNAEYTAEWGQLELVAKHRKVGIWEYE